MSELEVQIVRLDPMRVASVQAVSRSPERDAWTKLKAWAEPQGLLADVERHPVFGFNNPPPVMEGEEYGYELWIRVGPEVDGEGEVEVKDFPGGRYAVTTCKLHGDPRGPLPEVWKELWHWVRESGEFEWRHTHELEKVHDPTAAEADLVLDLYLPIEG